MNLCIDCPGKRTTAATTGTTSAKEPSTSPTAASAGPDGSMTSRWPTSAASTEKVNFDKTQLLDLNGSADVFIENVALST